MCNTVLSHSEVTEVILNEDVAVIIDQIYTHILNRGEWDEIMGKCASTYGSIGKVTEFLLKQLLFELQKSKSLVSDYALETQKLRDQLVIIIIIISF